MGLYARVMGRDATGKKVPKIASNILCAWLGEVAVGARTQAEANADLGIDGGSAEEADFTAQVARLQVPNNGLSDARLYAIWMLAEDGHAPYQSETEVKAELGI